MPPFIPGMVGSSPAMRLVADSVTRIADTDAPVLIEGETGTGKEMIARALHYLSRRRDYPFVPVNCGALPDTLLESELFGHVKGAFTGAEATRQGLLAQAAGGTLFLDEVDTLSPRAQVALLRFLQDGTYRPVGGSRLFTADVRVLAASNAKLRAKTERGEFRPDLFYRLDVVSLYLPPLRERGDDIEELARHFLGLLAARYQRPVQRLHADTLTGFRRYAWPGNVRELENLLHRAVLMAEGEILEIPPPFHAGSGLERRHNGYDRRRGAITHLPFAEAKSRILAEFESDYLTRLLDECGGNVSQAARQAKKERRSFSRLLKKYGVERGRARNWPSPPPCPSA